MSEKIFFFIFSQFCLQNLDPRHENHKPRLPNFSHTCNYIRCTSGVIFKVLPPFSGIAPWCLKKYFFSFFPSFAYKTWMLGMKTISHQLAEGRLDALSKPAEASVKKCLSGLNRQTIEKFTLRPSADKTWANHQFSYTSEPCLKIVVEPWKSHQTCIIHCQKCEKSLGAIAYYLHA